MVWLDRDGIVDLEAVDGLEDIQAVASRINPHVPQGFEIKMYKYVP